MSERSSKAPPKCSERADCLLCRDLRESYRAQAKAWEALAAAARIEARLWARSGNTLKAQEAQARTAQCDHEAELARAEEAAAVPRSRRGQH